MKIIQLDLLKLNIYGYMNEIRSSRKLEIESKKNLEIMWLINKVTPDYGTISSFVKNNKKVFRKILKEFSLLLKGWGLVDGKLIAIDGTKLKANNSRKKYLNIQTLNKKIEYIDSKINEYMLAIEASSIEQNVDTINLPETNIGIKEKLEEYKNRKKEFEIIKNNMKSKGLKQISFTDPDSRGMKNNGKAEICYNVQTAVDSKNNLIIECDVVNDINDLNQLSNMALKAKKVLRKRKLNVVADTGYYNAEEIKICLDKKVKVYIKKSALNNSTGKVEFKKWS